MANDQTPRAWLIAKALRTYRWRPGSTWMNSAFCAPSSPFMYENAWKAALSARTAASGTASSTSAKGSGAAKSSRKEQLQCSSSGHTTSSGRLDAAATAIADASARSRLPSPNATEITTCFLSEVRTASRAERQPPAAARSTSASGSGSR